MSARWQKVTLGEILTERREAPSPEDLARGRIPIVSKISFDTGTIELRQEPGTKTNIILVRPGDLLFSGINAVKGAVALYDRNNREPIAATIHYSAYSVKEHQADSRYLWWYLRSKSFRELLFQSVPNGIKTELKASRLLPLRIPLPPLEEQRRIVTRIEQLARQVYVAERLRDEAVQLTKRFLESNIEAVMRPETARGSIADVVSLKPRSGPSFLTHRDWTGTPVLMPSAVSGFGVDISKVEFGIGTERINARDRLEPGDILIARGNKREQVGNAGVVPEAARGWVAANLLMRTRLNPDRADPHFFVYWLRSPTMRRLVSERMSGTSPNIQKINQSKILEFPFPTQITVNDQRRIVAKLDALQAQVEAIKRLQAETAAGLKGLLPSILDEAFKGES